MSLGGFPVWLTPCCLALALVLPVQGDSKPPLPVVVHGLVNFSYLDLDAPVRAPIAMTVSALEDISDLSIVARGLGETRFSLDGECDKLVIVESIKREGQLDVGICLAANLLPEAGQSVAGHIILFTRDHAPLQLPLSVTSYDRPEPTWFKAMQWVLGFAIPVFVGYVVWRLQQGYAAIQDVRTRWSNYQADNRPVLTQYFTDVYPVIYQKEIGEFASSLAKDLLDRGWRPCIPGRLNKRLEKALDKLNQQKIVSALNACFPDYKHLTKPS